MCAFCGDVKSGALVSTVTRIFAPRSNSTANPVCPELLSEFIVTRSSRGPHAVAVITRSTQSVERIGPSYYCAVAHALAITGV